MSKNQAVEVWIDNKSVILRDNFGRNWLATYLPSNKMRLSEIDLGRIDRNLDQDVDQDLDQDVDHPMIGATKTINVELYDFGISTHRGLERAAMKYINSMRYSNA